MCEYVIPTENLCVFVIAAKSCLCAAVHVCMEISKVLIAGWKIIIRMLLVNAKPQLTRNIENQIEACECPWSQCDERK